MKFLRLSVKSFRGIAEADIDLKAGLNILFGPNEAGKSTLAEALRAVLLCRATSAAAETYLPALGAGTPEVSLTFEDPSGDWYRIEKSFGDRPSTSLERSANRGQTFVREATGDGAETELRKRLRWGLRPPGGRGGPRGVESTFLTQTLLAEQTMVDTIFKEGLDPESTEQVGFVQEALAAALDNPRFKEALKCAERRCGLYFTSRGHKTRGASSPWKRAKDLLNEAQANLDAARKAAEEITALESSLHLAQDEAIAARRALGDAKAERHALDEKLEAAKHREALASAVQAARKDLEAAVDKRNEVDRLRARVNKLKGALEAKAAELEKAGLALQTARDQREEAQAQLQRVEAAEGNAQRELQVARLESSLTDLRHEDEDLQRRMKAAESLAREEKKLGDLRARIEAEQAAFAEHTELEGRTSQQITDLEAERIAALIVEADRRLQAARDREEKAAREVQGARTANEEANAKRLVEGELLTRLEGYGDLDVEQVDRVRKLHHDLDKHRSAAEAGLSIAIDRLQVLTVGAQVDDEAPDQHTSSTGHLQLDARRRIQLDLGGLARLDVTAGSPEARAALAKAGAAWAQDGQTLLEQHNVTSIEALDHRLRARTETEHQLRSVQRERKDLSARAQLLPAAQDALAHAQHETREAESARSVLPTHTEAIPTASVRELDDQLTALRTTVKRVEAERIESDVALRQLKESEHDKAAQVAEQQRALGEPGHELLVQGRTRLDEIKEQIETLTRQRGVLEEGRDEALRAAKGAVSSAEEALESANRRKQSLEEERRDIERELGEARGTLTSEEAHIAALDLEGRKRRRDESQAALEAHPPVDIEPDSVATVDSRIQQAENRVEETERAVISLESRLAASEGALAEERLEEATAAYAVAEADYKATEVDGEASKLVVDTLKEAEAKSTRHLGAAIGEDVETRFAELTGDRYGGVSVDKTLIAREVHLGEAVLRPDQLSVGTRHQLAILLRLILAEQLGHPIVLDDQLVQSDPERLAWFRSQLAESATRTQILVLSCRPKDYDRPDGRHEAHLIDVPTHVRLTRVHDSVGATGNRKTAAG